MNGERVSQHHIGEIIAPEFPVFKLLELSDKKQIEKITSQFQPYSDFNFASLWSWNLTNKIAISKFNENIVVNFTDYITNEEFYSFIGNKKVTETAKELMSFLFARNLKPNLRLVPEVSVVDIDRNKINVIEDRDNFDYIYNVEELSNLQGAKFSKKRNHVRAFLRNFSHATHKILSLKDDNTVMSIFKFLGELNHNKKKNTITGNPHNEHLMTKLLEAGQELNLVVLGVFIDNKLVAMFVNEIINSEYALGHLMAADTSIDGGLYAFLMKKMRKLFLILN